MPNIGVQHPEGLLCVRTRVGTQTLLMLAPCCTACCWALDLSLGCRQDQNGVKMSRAHREEGSKVMRVRARAGACHVASRYVPTPASPPGAGTPGAGVEPGAVSAGRFECNSSLCRRECPGGKATRISAGRHLSPSSQGLWASPAGSSSVPALPGSVRSVLGSGPLGRRTQQQSWLI